MATPHCTQTVYLVIGLEQILHTPILAAELALYSDLDFSEPSQNTREGIVVKEPEQYPILESQKDI